MSSCWEIYKGITKYSMLTLFILDVGILIQILCLFLLLSTFLIDNHILEMLFIDEKQTDYVQMILSPKAKSKRAVICTRTH